ncbi:DUF7149 domain-containing protein [Roseivirga echinicomitans]
MIKLNVRKSLNKAFLKVKPNRTDIEEFKANLIQLIDRTNDTESEEFHKNLVSDFLKKTYYEPDYFINTKGRNDLVIHTGKSAKTPVGVIVEAKKPTNKAEMLSNLNINTKAFQELVLYFLRERITLKNLEIKNLIASNINEWFVFDANMFEKKFAQNKKLVKQFEDFEGGRLAGKSTDFFYKEIAQPFIESIKEEIEFTYFDLRDYEKPLRNDDPKDDNRLIALFKVLSPEHLLKLPFVNDSNSLDKKFYSELLHIIGLTETKEGGKKVIQRKKKGERNQGALLENAIDQLDTLDKVNRLPKPSQYGETSEERLFNVGLELSITWVNRILFLKLLEAQLVTYHKGDPKYTFLNFKKITDYDKLNSLFFQVLAKRTENRNEEALKEFSYVPYLNSSLFEPNEMEHTTILISNLRDEKKLPILSNTVLKDTNGKKRTGEINALEYFFEFLDAYDFSSEGGEDIQEDNKALINAAVLGLIFEKINGYKDGSFFTPGFITMYMCRETIRRSVVQKFNETKGWNCTDLNQVYDKIDDTKEANEIVNSLKICDPAVGSGHFLVSALNEMIAIKNDLKILQDREGRRLKEYHFEVVNDELIVTDEDGEFFEYSPTNKESQRIQETLFHEKQTIIENCLFGVDINPNSVKICRLRLWIELLKNAYYKAENELETLPNIDINIKCGNSLISRFDLDADIKEALKKSKWSIDSYKLAVNSYRNAQSKEEKHEMERLINDIKSDFRSEISKNDPKLKKLYKISGELAVLTTQTSLFDMAAKEKKEWRKKVEKLTTDTKKLETEIEEIKNNKIYENAFEWRFEFPEVLNEQGDFIGFDVVIGNPPYVQQRKSKGATLEYSKWYSVYSGTADLSVFFFERGFSILKQNGGFSFISTNKFFNTEYGVPLRGFLSEYVFHDIINFELVPIFDEALVSSVILTMTKQKNFENFHFVEFNSEVIDQEKFKWRILNDSKLMNSESLINDSWLFSKAEEQKVLDKIRSVGREIGTIDSIHIKRGITTGFDNAFIIKADSKLQSSPVSQCFYRGKDIHRYFTNENGLKLLFIPWHFPNHNDEDVLGASNKSEQDFQVQYPNEYSHLNSFRTELSNRNKSETGIRYEWYALQRCAASYYDLFKEEKIIWGLISGGWDFSYDNKGYLLTSASFFLTSENIPVKFILSLFNSNVFKFMFSVLGEKTAGGAYVFKKTTIEKLVLPNVINVPDGIVDLVEEILSLKKSNPNTDTSRLEAEIDQMVYQLYGLTEEEIAIVEEAVK